MSNCDYGIIGGGIAGLYLARELSKKYPQARIALFEKYKVLGGRVKTNRFSVKGKSIQYESGAGRVFEDHTRIRTLLKEYGCTEIPISDVIEWKESYESGFEPNAFETSLPTWLPELRRLPADELANHTLHTLLVRIFGPLEARAMTIQFPYWAEIFTLRADLAIESFEREMGTQKGYTVAKEGYEKMIHGLVRDCEKKGVKISTNFDVKEIFPSAHGFDLHIATGPLKQKDKRNVILCECKNLVFATHPIALQKFSLLKDWDTLKKVQMEPLCRVYSVFPVDTSGHSWFSKLPKFVTPTPIRYFIPINPSNGLVMISYTDGKDTEKIRDIWEAKGEEALGKYLTEECRKQFSALTIPDPELTKVEFWKEGASYWVPGDYDVKEESRKSLQPYPKIFPNLYVCGEGFSLKQAWMEGAVETVDKLLKQL